ncbi:hypothetical protein [Glycomyces sp. NPDC048151]|uniref:hypothetical protein n=1 Tax=Glycomyces sp. NPDC048151 TaxID=3364002 RepID=UPI0037206DF7
MGNEPTPVGEFNRDTWRFAVYPERQLYRVEAREVGSKGLVICRTGPFTNPEWYRTWHIDAWRPWIELETRKVITSHQSP